MLEQMLRWVRVAGVAVFVAAGLSQFTADASAQSDASETVWVFKEIIPNTAPSGSFEVVTRSATGFHREVTVEPTAEFTADFPEMMIASAPLGYSHTFTVQVAGRILPDADTGVQGFRVHDAIRIVNGWDGRTAVGVGVNCVTDIFGAPLGCTPPAGTFVRASEEFTVTFPSFVPSDGLFEFGVGALNCGECFVGYVYEAKTVKAAPKLTCGGAIATIGPEDRNSSGKIIGTSGPDVIVGSAGPDVINGRGGRDIICGKGGADLIRGGSGNDLILGGPGGDAIRAGKGSDRVRGGGGKDEIWGNAGNDDLEGGRHDDIIHGDAGDDSAKGGPGTDRCAAERETSCEKDPRIPGPQVKWTMPDRYGASGQDGIVRPTKVLDPKRFTVEFKLRRSDGSRCSADDKVKPRSAGGKFYTPDTDKPCRLEGRFPEGTHRVQFTLTTDEGKGKTALEVVVQDWLIVGIGDSNGSGEGTPDVPGGSSAKWVNKQCHRSANSYQALVAARVENGDRQTSVTFRHLSCSGAQIAVGLLEPYRGIVEGKELKPQLDRLDTIASKREVDAVLISAGVNDLHFGEMVAFCVKWRDCPNTTWETAGSETLDQVMTRFLNTLPGLYRQLNDRLVAAGIPADRVYIGEYFDSTKDEDGVVCDPLIRFGVGFASRDFDQAEATWAANSVLLPLNQQVRAAAERYGWNLVTGTQAGFVTHGYCAGDRSWIVTRAQSKANQGNEDGTLHATLRGNRFQRNLTVPVVTADLYDPQRNPRPPR